MLTVSEVLASFDNGFARRCRDEGDVLERKRSVTTERLREPSPKPP
jgi:hypothetical protein